MPAVTQADGMAVPYGIHEMQLNRGDVYVGTNADTPQIAEFYQSLFVCSSIRLKSAGQR